MSNEIAFHNLNETDTIYAVLKNMKNRAQVVNPATLAVVTLAAADWADYDIPMRVLVAETGDYLADFPSVVAGRYLVEVHLQAGDPAAITDQILHAYTLDWSGTGVASALGGEFSGSTAIYTGKGLFDDLKHLCGADAPGASGRATFVGNMVKVCGGKVWNLSPWVFRHVVLDLVTVAGQAYTTLPTTYARIPEFGDWLVEKDTDSDRPAYVSPERFQQVVENMDDDGLADSPEIFTIGYEEISSVWTPVIRWAGTPASVKTYKGFQYFRAFPGVDITDDAAVLFPDVAFDDLWEMLCIRRISQRIRLAEHINPPTLREWNEAVSEARANLEFKPPSNVPLDVYRDTADVRGLVVGGGTEDYNADGGVLLGDGGW